MAAFPRTGAIRNALTAGVRRTRPRRPRPDGPGERCSLLVRIGALCDWALRDWAAGITTSPADPESGNDDSDDTRCGEEGDEVGLHYRLAAERLPGEQSEHQDVADSHRPHEPRTNSRAPKTDHPARRDLEQEGGIAAAPGGRAFRRSAVCAGRHRSRSTRGERAQGRRPQRGRCARQLCPRSLHAARPWGWS